MEAIKVSGINRDPRNDEHGVCSEIINMRFKDGSWVPVGKKQVKTPSGTPAVSIVFVHNIDPDTDIQNATAGKNYIGYNNTRGEIITWELDDPDNYTVIADIGNGKASFLSFTALKNMVVISDSQDKKLMFLAWTGSGYTFIEDRLPKLLDLNISSSLTGWYPPLIITPPPKSIEKEYNEVSTDSFKAVYGDWLTSIRKLGFDEGIVAVRYAYELFDGSIVCHSNPKVMFLDPGNHPMIYENIDYSTGKIYAYGGKLYLTYVESDSNDEILSKLNNEYKNLIKNVVMFMTKPIPSNDPNRLGWYEGGEYSKVRGYGEESSPGVPSGKRFDTDILNGIYYKVLSVPVDKIGIPILYEGELVQPYLFAEPGDLNNYEGLEILTQDDFSHHTINSSSNLIYNGRLIIGDISVRLFNGYDPSSLFTPVGEETVDPYYIDMYFRLKTESGERAVVISSSSTFTHRVISYPVVLSYPDKRAYAVNIVKRDASTEELDILFNHTLTPLQFHNLSVKLFINYGTETPPTIDWNNYVPEISPLPDTSKNSYTDSNIVKMSALNNPLTFPSKYTYAVGLSRIIGFETNTIPISQGQFGQFPILVFTESGMWAMELGDGGTVISNVVPLNDHICNNPASITRAGGLVVFSTSEGLIMLNGGDGILLSQPLRGDYASPIATKSELINTYLAHPQLVHLRNSLSETDFALYLKSNSSVAHIGYDQKNRELIVSNNNYDYSYVYSFANNVWTKITETFQYFIKDYPNTYGVTNGNNIVDITAEDAVPVETLIITRPIYLDNLSKLERLGVKASIDTDDERITGLYMYGSVDGRNWNFITGIQKPGDFNNPYVNRAMMSFREAIVVIAGKYRSTTYLRDIVLEVRRSRYINKTIR